MRWGRRKGEKGSVWEQSACSSSPHGFLQS